MPFMLAPVGFCRMFYPRGEVYAAREASGSRYRIHPVYVLGDSTRGGPRKAPAVRSGISSTSRAAAPSPRPRSRARRRPDTPRSS